MLRMRVEGACGLRECARECSMPCGLREALCWEGQEHIKQRRVRQYVAITV